MKKGKNYFFVIISIYFLANTFGAVVYAKKTFNDAGSALGTVVQKTGIDQGDVGSYIGTLIQYALTVAGIIFFGLMVYAGIMWMTARGEEDKVTKARNTLIASTIGMAILVGSYALTTFVQQKIIDRQAGGGVSNIGNSSQIGNEPTGCCYDWVKANGGIEEDCRTDEFTTNPTKAWRITTYSDCEHFGSQYIAGVDDCWYGPEEDGVWLFTEGQEANECEDNL